MSRKIMVSFVMCIFCLFCISEVLAARKLIVVLIDGVRWDYIKDPNLKGIPRIIDNGVKAPYVIPVFPSLSYPNWYSIVTGLYAENHGFVGNHMYDNESHSVFEMIPEPGSTDPHWWNEAEPVWVTAEKNSRRSALYWWGGCEVEIKGTHPTICERQLYDGPPIEEAKIDFLERVDDMIEMFKPSKRFPMNRLSLALMYYGSVDFAGHHSGPNSPEVKSALYEIDGLLDKMQSKIKNAGLENEVNIMVVSDHGMTNVKEGTTKYIDLKKYAPRIKYQMDFGGESMILPQPEMLDMLFNELTADKIEGLQFYKKEDIPEKYHIKNSKRTPPLLLIAKKGYYIKSLEDHEKRLGGKPQQFVGHHGHDPEAVDDMRTIFFATGPDFHKGFNTEALYITDLYNVMCSVLQIPPQPNNGSWERVEPMLKGRSNRISTIASGTVLNAGNNHHFVYTIFTVSLSALFSLLSFRLL